jgi:hypothetical protein
MIKKKAKSPRTQYFSGVLMLAMERNHISQVELSATSGITTSRINNYLHGRYRTIRPDHLEVLTKSACQTQAERSELIRTYLLDLLPQSFHDQIRIEVERGKSRTSDHPATYTDSVPLPITTAAALGELQLLCARSAKARSQLEQFAEILREAHGA